MQNYFQIYVLNYSSYINIYSYLNYCFFNEKNKRRKKNLPFCSVCNTAITTTVTNGNIAIQLTMNAHITYITADPRFVEFVQPLNNIKILFSCPKKNVNRIRDYHLKKKTD